MNVNDFLDRPDYCGDPECERHGYEATRDRKTLTFGWDYGLVNGVKAAWGARAIVTQDGTVDILRDRTSHFGDSEDVIEVTDWLQSETVNYKTGYDLDGDQSTTTVLGKAIANLKGGLRQGIIKTREAGGQVLYQDREGAVIANTNASAGYCYIAAFLFTALPDGHPTRGLEIALNIRSDNTDPIKELMN